MLEMSPKWADAKRLMKYVKRNELDPFVSKEHPLPEEVERVKVHYDEKVWKMESTTEYLKQPHNDLMNGLVSERARWD
jgi:hypothetical protein